MIFHFAQITLPGGTYNLTLVISAAKWGLYPVFSGPTSNLPLGFHRGIRRAVYNRQPHGFGPQKVNVQLGVRKLGKLRQRELGRDTRGGELTAQCPGQPRGHLDNKPECQTNINSASTSFWKRHCGWFFEGEGNGVGEEDSIVAVK